MNTTNDIDAIRQRAAKATHGPWRVGEKTPTGADLWERPIIRDVEGEDGPFEDQVCAVEYQTGGFHFPHGEALADAEFIAAARTDVPALLAKVDELTAERDLNNDLLDGTAKALGLDLDYAHVHHEVPAKVAELVAALTQSRQQAATYANEIGALKADLERTRQQFAEAHDEGRRKAAADIENMDHDLGDDGWAWLQEKAVGAGYDAEPVRRRRTRLDFTTATIEMAYQYGYRTAAKVARGEVAR